MKKIELAGLGAIQINGLKFKDQEGEAVDVNGQPLKYVVEGKGTSKYVRPDGTECPRTEVCKKFSIEGEDVIVPKLKPTTKIDADVITAFPKGEHNNCETKAIEKAWYLVNAGEKIKAELDNGKTFEFPLVTGSGHKLWKAVLKNYELPNGKVCQMMFAIRGNIDTAIEQFLDNPIEIELPMATDQKKNIKSLFKAIGA